MESIGPLKLSNLSKLNERSILLLDGIGACLSAILTGLLLPLFSNYIGLERELLWVLALMPLVFAFYSLGSFRFAKKIDTSMLLGLAIANLFYCAVSVWILISHPKITLLGRAILAVELLVLVLIIAAEMKIFLRLNKTKS